MSFESPTRLELAIHEAGHAYAYAALNRWDEPEELGLGADGNGAAHGWCRRTTLLHRSVCLQRVPTDALPAIEWQAAAEVVIAIAGPMAEFRHRRRSRMNGGLMILANVEKFLQPGAFDVDGDFERIRATLDYIGPTDKPAALRALADVAESVVAANWASIRRLGRHLDERGLLNADQITGWFAAHPVRWEPFASDLGALVRH